MMYLSVTNILRCIMRKGKSIGIVYRFILVPSSLMHCVCVCVYNKMFHNIELQAAVAVGIQLYSTNSCVMHTISPTLRR